MARLNIFVEHYSDFQTGEKMQSRIARAQLADMSDLLWTIVDSGQWKFSRGGGREDICEGDFRTSDRLASIHCGRNNKVVKKIRPSMYLRLEQ